LLLAGDTWWEMGVCDATQGRYAGFMDKVEQDARNIRQALEAEFRVVSSGIVHAVEAAVAEARRFNQERDACCTRSSDQRPAPGPSCGS
jgi:hypothetical protein